MPDLIHLYENEKYIRLTDLNSRQSVSLVKETATGRLFVRRIVDPSGAEVYRKLQKSSCRHIPVIYEITETAGPDGFPGGEEDSRHAFFVYEEYIEGSTLEEILCREGTLDEREAVEYMHQLCEALDWIHSFQVIHRDIKPQNLMISSSGVLYLIDFDISRIYKAEKTSDTVIMGTEGYASPEQYGFRESDSRSDIYSACVLFNVMLTGTFPSKSIEWDRKPHDAFWKVIRKGTALDPSRRFSSAWNLNLAVGKAEKQVFRDSLWNNKQTKRKSVPGGFSWTYIPGFRSRTPWKMTVAVILYGLVLAAAAGLMMLCFDKNSIDIPEDSAVVLSAFYIHWAGLYVFLFNVFNIRSCFRSTRTAGSGSSYILRSLMLVLRWWFVTLALTFCSAIFII